MRRESDRHGRKAVPVFCALYGAVRAIGSGRPGRMPDKKTGQTRGSAGASAEKWQKGEMMDFVFVGNSIALGVGLAMDAFSVSIANGLNEPSMSRRKMSGIAGTYAGFQFAMPMIGWFCVHTIAEQFEIFRGWIPWIALVLLLWIGGKMLVEGIRSMRGTGKEEEEAGSPSGEACLGIGTLMVQGIATSIDALSVGFTIADYGAGMAVTSCLLIAVTTFVICMAGLLFGKKFGEKLADKATILGGVILIAIGLEIFLKGIFG